MLRLQPLAVALLAFASLVAAQTETSRQLLVTVVDPRVRPIVDLDPDDFVVTEGGRPREVFSVHAADYPLLLLMDAGRTPADTAAMRAAAERFIERIGGERQLGLATLADGDLRVALDADRAELLRALQQIQTVPADRPALASLTAAARQLDASDLPFVTIVVLCEVNADTTPPDQQAQLLTALTETRARVHIIAKSASTPDAPLAEDILRRAAALTRGLYTRIFTTASYQAAIDRLADSLAAEMMVEYLVPAGQSPAGGGPAAEVGVRIPGARVIALGSSR